MHVSRMLLPVLFFIQSSSVRGADVAPDPFLGRWELDVVASNYAPGACPKRMLIDMTSEARGTHYHSETELVTGDVFHVDYTAAYDGKPAVVIGDRGMLLPVSLTRLDVHHVKASYSSGFQVEAVSDRVVSPDGKTMTITTTSRDRLGRQQVNVGTYRHRYRP